MDVDRAREWITPAEAAAMLGISRTTVLRLRRCGLPAFRVGPRQIRIPRRELLEWVRAQNPQ